MKGREVREGMDMAGEGGNCEKDLRLAHRELQRRVDESRKERSPNISLEERDGRERQRWSEERVLSEGLIFMRLCR